MLMASISTDAAPIYPEIIFANRFVEGEVVAEA